jgi:hypothetical protein
MGQPKKDNKKKDKKKFLNNVKMWGFLGVKVSA